jgi:carbon-monoxide dehydrogenase small subunit
MSQHRIRVTVNGEVHEADVSSRITLVDFLRDALRLTGTHTGCEHGVCGACSVSFNGRPIRSCLMFAVQADGAAITTVEGLAPSEDALSVLQDCFWEKHALQCGFCTPGMLIASQSLLNENKDPTEEDVREAISGNLCRCTGYKQIVEAVLLAAKRLQGKNAPDHADEAAQ